MCIPFCNGGVTKCLRCLMQLFSCALYANEHWLSIDLFLENGIHALISMHDMVVQSMEIGEYLGILTGVFLASYLKQRGLCLEGLFQSARCQGDGFRGDIYPHRAAP